MSTALNSDEYLDGSGNRISPALRTEALEQLLTERGLIDPEVIAAYGTLAGRRDRTGQQLVTRDATVGVTDVTR